MKNIVNIHDFESRLKRKIRSHLKSLGYVIEDKKLIAPELTKDNIRKLHSKQRQDILISKNNFFKRLKPSIFDYFADGLSINPKKIKPRLEIVESRTNNADLFNLASFTWSIPVSLGYGRRIRFLVWDDYNGKLMGLLAIKDPAINSKPREEYIGWDIITKHQKLVNVMDSYIVGSIPPYNQLLCGKLISCLLKTIEIKDIFNKKYKNTVGIISEKNKNSKLTLITTSSALGRSSIYNRLSLNNEKFMIPIAYTDGWGHFHFSQDILDDFHELLRRKNHPYFQSFKYKQGANYKFRKIRKSLQILGFSINLMQHKIKRELFITPIANNYIDILNNKAKRPDYSSLKSVEEVGDLAKDRWIIPRSLRNKNYKNWQRSSIKKIIFNDKGISELPLFKSLDEYQ